MTATGEHAQMTTLAQHPGGIVGCLEGSEDMLPHADPLPAAEAAVHRPPGAESLRQVTPRRAGAESTEEHIHDGPVIPIRADGS